MIIRPERPDDAAAIRQVTSAAFASAAHSAPPVDDSGAPGEATLVDWLRADPGFLPHLSLVAETDRGRVVGHGICTRGYVADLPALGLGPISVDPAHQHSRIGTGLVEALLSTAREHDEVVVALLGDPGFYGRFGFGPAAEAGITAPDAAWGDYFQVLVLQGPPPAGPFRYAAPFDRLAQITT